MELQRSSFVACLLRPGVLAVAGAVALLAACTAEPLPVLDAPPVMYAAVTDGDFKLPAINIRRVDPKFLRQVVDTPQNIREVPGTIIVDPKNRFLYFILGGGKSMRYGIGVGREGFAWSGDATIKDKQEWPKWYPPEEMVKRDPRLRPVAKGMDGGLRNPLGARAMYLWSNGVDTLYRIHGTNEPSSIGRAVSSGCVRMFNQDVIDLYSRVPLGAKVIVLPAADETKGMT
jgi:lipoprotein-anchoring transpeptidase ErfK/SrfK